jgi:hypothetical protein
MSADSAQANRSLLSLLADDVVPQIRRSSWPTSNGTCVIILLSRVIPQIIASSRLGDPSTERSYSRLKAIISASSWSRARLPTAISLK